MVLSAFRKTKLSTVSWCPGGNCQQRWCCLAAWRGGMALAVKTMNNKSWASGGPTSCAEQALRFWRSDCEVRIWVSSIMVLIVCNRWVSLMRPSPRRNRVLNQWNIAATDQGATGGSEEDCKGFAVQCHVLGDIQLAATVWAFEVLKGYVHSFPWYFCGESIAVVSLTLGLLGCCFVLFF